MYSVFPARFLEIGKKVKCHPLFEKFCACSHLVVFVCACERLLWNARVIIDLVVSASSTIFLFFWPVGDGGPIEWTRRPPLLMLGLFLSSQNLKSYKNQSSIKWTL